VILDCDFCPNVVQVPDRETAVNQGWNWMESVINGGEKVKTSACPDCEESQVSELHEEKHEQFTAIGDVAAEAVKDPAQSHLQTGGGGA
jgi:hypothetical protein